jgi:peptidoglycan DL-endopeptidase CwlO
MNLLTPPRSTGAGPSGGSGTRRLVIIGVIGSSVLLLLGLLTVPLLIVGGTSLIFGGDGGGCTGTVTQPAASNAADSIPADYLKWYKIVGQQYGIPWTILAGIGTEESDNGQSTLEGVHSGANPFGAAGPMQIGIGGASGNEWSAVATAEDGIEPPSVYDPADAIAGAAKYLIAHGAKADMSAAIFAYNHATWYVQQVEAYASRYAAGGYTVDADVTGCGSTTVTSDFATVPNTTVAEALAYVQAQLGKPYLFGGEGPDSFDCSGLVMMAYLAAGIDIPRTSEEQWTFGPQVPAADVEPGDLVFFAGADGTMTSPGHVGIVINPATHTMIDAYATGFNVEIDTYGLPTSKGGLSPVVGFTRPWAHASQ